VSLFLLRLQKLATIVRNPGLMKPFVFLGVVAAVEHLKVLEHIRAKTIVDVGANRGQFALAASLVNPETVFSFEPLPLPAGVYRKIFKGKANFRVFQAAISCDFGVKQMNVSGRDDSSSLLTISALQDQLFPGTRKSGTLEIKAAPLNEFLNTKDISHPALLKIDVQGYELQVLEGSESLLPYFSFIYIECSFLELYEEQSLAADIVKKMQVEGFDLVGIYNVSYDKSGIAIQGDFLFEANIKRKEGSRT